MKRGCSILLLILYSAAFPIRSIAKDDFLTSDEVSVIRDAADPGQKVILYLEFAQRRLTAAQEKTVSKDAASGQAIQKFLDQYNSMLDALDDALQEARKQRSELAKVLKEVQSQGAHFLKVLDQLSNAPMRGDYQYTVAESIETTKDEMAEAKKGAFPEVTDRAPRDLPAAPPPPSKSGNSEEGPPRKPGRGLPNNQ